MNTPEPDNPNMLASEREGLALLNHQPEASVEAGAICFCCICEDRRQAEQRARESTERD